MEKTKMFGVNIIKNPIGWAGSMVGTKVRYVLSMIILPAFVLLILSNITEASLREYWSSALLLISIQLMFLFALRKLYQKIEDVEEES